MNRRQKITEHYLIPLTLACVTVCLLNLLWLLHLLATPETHAAGTFLMGLALLLLLLSLKYRNHYLVILANAFFLLLLLLQWNK